MLRDIVIYFGGVITGFVLNGIITLSILDNRVDNLQVPLGGMEIWLEEINFELSNLEAGIEKMRDNTLSMEHFSRQLVWTLRSEINDWNKLDK